MGILSIIRKVYTEMQAFEETSSFCILLENNVGLERKEKKATRDQVEVLRIKGIQSIQHMLKDLEILYPRGQKINTSALSKKKIVESTSPN